MSPWTKEPIRSSQASSKLGDTRVEYRGNRFLVDRVGTNWNAVTDGYHFMMTTSWLLLALVGFAAYVVTIALFAVLYHLDPDGISGGDGTFLTCFWFSMQTLSTIGYGALSPESTWTNAWAGVESFVGMVGVALGTGLVFAKFSRPTARVAFSDKMVLHERNGVPTLMFRVANKRANQIVEARIHVTVLVDETTEEGHHIRRLRDLLLERNFSPLFALTWTLFHPIDEDSPLAGVPMADLADHISVIVVTMTGIDDTFSQTVTDRHVYLGEDVYYGHRYTDMLSRGPSGRMQIDLSKISAVEPLNRR